MKNKKLSRKQVAGFMKWAMENKLIVTEESRADMDYAVKRLFNNKYITGDELSDYLGLTKATIRAK